MGHFTLVLALIELIAIIVLVIVVIKQGRAFSNHVKKLKDTLPALKESLEQQIEKVSNHEEINALKEEMKRTLESHRKVMGEKIEAHRLRYENLVQKISERLGDSLEKVSGTRIRIAEEIRRFGRIIGAALRGEEELLKALAEPEEQQPTDSRSEPDSEEGESTPPSGEESSE